MIHQLLKKKLSDDASIILSGQIGLDLPVELGQPTACSEGQICWQWGTAARLLVDQTSGDFLITKLRF